MRNAVRLRSVARYIPHTAADRHVRYDHVPLETPLRRTQAGDSLDGKFICLVTWYLVVSTWYLAGAVFKDP